ncbi:hypothetical protein BS47DRAFT_1347663 [Hydnum rufescens UP504]|uniref:Uncharacterized protein n=1 Tax=Hydnum rufescens UP504 TaxID=1448309 RepID=A0A9P6ARP9_9AGAM|nr:hypothetical protein BS47DRAFT_1347663 [Hydnum rufescens UP504]
MYIARGFIAPNEPSAESRQTPTLSHAGLLALYLRGAVKGAEAPDYCNLQGHVHVVWQIHCQEENRA